MGKLKHLLLVAIILLDYYSPASSVGRKSEDAQIHTETGTIAPSDGEETETDTGKSFQNQATDKINELRQRHGSPKLGLDKELTTNAQKHADKIAKSGDVGMSCTRNDCPFGENVGMGPPNPKLAIEVKKSIQRWYDTGAEYNFKTGKGKNRIVPGAFTQLIWKSSTRVGIGAAVNKDTKYVYVVVQFSPPGNVEGEFIKNLPPLKSGGSIATKGHIGKSEQSADEAADSAPSQDDQASEDGPAPAKHSKVTSMSKRPQAGKSPGKAYQNQIIDVINDLRAQHHAPNLKLDKSLTEIAQAGAEKSAEKGQMGYTCDGNDCKYGENQGMGSSSPNMVVAVKEIIDSWYADEPSYDYKLGKEKAGKEFPGAFTQLIWKGSTLAGIGAKETEDGKVYVIVTFKPPGNVAGLFTKNVLQP